jgi:hypothetical protein
MSTPKQNDMANVDAGDNTDVQGTTVNAGQPVVSVDDSAAFQPTQDPTDEEFVGLVKVKYNGSEAYNQDGISFVPGETKVMNASDARVLLNDSNFTV